jgi:hypothetical protein
MQQIFRDLDTQVQLIGNRFNQEMVDLINKHPIVSGEIMIKGQGWNYKGKAETDYCKFMRLFMNLFRPTQGLILQNPPNTYTNYYFNTWQRYIGQYRYNLWQYNAGDEGYDPEANGIKYEKFKLIPDNNMGRGAPVQKGGSYNIQTGGQFYQNPQYQNSQYQNPQYQNQQYQNQLYQNQLYQNQPLTNQYGYLNPSTYLNSNDQYYQALLNLNNAQNLQYLTNSQVSGIIQNLSNFKNTNISYQITIDLELQKGEKLSSFDYITAKCRTKRNKIRKIYSEITGLKYTIPPVYENLLDKPLTEYKKKDKDEDINNLASKIRKIFNKDNKTRKNR